MLKVSFGEVNNLTVPEILLKSVIFLPDRALDKLSVLCTTWQLESTAIVSPFLRHIQALSEKGGSTHPSMASQR